MTQPDVTLPNTLELELYAGLKVVQSQQSEINRRIGVIERILEERIVDPTRVADLEAWRDETSDSRRDWVTWGMQTTGSVILTTVLVLLGGKLGIAMAW